MSYRTLGIVCSLIATYQREIGKVAERKARNEKWANSTFIGALKKREVFEFKLTAEPIHYSNDFGGSYLYRFRYRNGNIVIRWGLHRTQRGSSSLLYSKFDPVAPWLGTP